MPEESIQEVLATMDPILRASLERLRQSIPQDSHLAKEVEEFKQAILEKPKRDEQLVFSFLPHQLAKTSIFFPLSDRELKEENRMIHRIEHQTHWGKVVIEGIKLAIFEEDILLALLHLAKDHTQKDAEGRYVLKVKMPEIAKILYGDKGYTERVYKIIDRTLGHFGLVRFEIIIGTWTKKGSERIHEEKKTTMAGIISGYAYDTKTQELTIYWNERFFVYFLESILTNINLTLRRGLKKDGSKAILRFLSTHNKPGRMNIFTVLNAINYNTNQHPRFLRRKLKQFISELKKHGVLGYKTRLFQDDTVYFDVLKSTKTLPD